MLAPKIRIPFYTMLCLMLSSCMGCGPAPEYECIETQDVAMIQTADHPYNYGFTFDNLVVRKGNEEMRCVLGFGDNRIPPILIGSQTHNVKFPININVQLFLRGVRLQSINFNMSKNSMLTFYDGSACDSTIIPNQIAQYQLRFQEDVQRAIDDGVFIDSSRSKITCWIMSRMTEDNGLNCTKVDGGRGGGGKHEVGICTEM